MISWLNDHFINVRSSEMFIVSPCLSSSSYFVNKAGLCGQKASVGWVVGKDEDECVGASH